MSNQPSEALKPCPFCKSKAIIGKFSDDYQTTGWAECTKSGCSASIEVDGGEQKAIAAWNTRKGEDERIAQAVAAERARIVERLEEQKAFAFRRANAAYERGNLREELIQSAARSAYAKAIEIVNQEQKE